MGRVNFGYILRKLRHGRDETLDQVSEATGISVAMLSRIERGERLPSPESVEALARHFDLPVDYLMSETIANRMVNRYGEESTSRAAEHLSREPLELGLIASEPDAQSVARDEAPTATDGMPSRGPSRSYGLFEEMDIRRALDARESRRSEKRSRDEVRAADQDTPPHAEVRDSAPPARPISAEHAEAPPSPGQAADAARLGLREEQANVPVSFGLIAPKASASSEVSRNRRSPEEPRAEIDPTTERVLRAAREASQAAAMLVLREYPSLSPKARLDVIDQVASLAGQSIDVLQILASDSDRRVRTAAREILRRLSR